MQWKRKGLATALLCMPFILTGGCGERSKTYRTGLVSERITEASQNSDFEESSLKEAKSDDSDEGRAEAVEYEEAETAGFVYVCGAVKEPGVYPVCEGMRVFEAIALAGGFAKGADEEWLNQADFVADGQKLYVFTEAETSRMQAETDAQKQLPETGVSVQNTKINLNTADRDTLMTLPGIGEAKADSILQYRTEHGAFRDKEELMEIPGIKQAVFSKIKDRITVQ